MPETGGCLASVAGVTRVDVAGSSSAAAGAGGAGAVGVVCRRTTNDVIVVPLMAREAPEDRVKPAGFCGGTAAFCHRYERTLRLWHVVSIMCAAERHWHHVQ